MAGRILPRYLILALTLSLVVVGIMLSMFYGQFRWLAGGIVDVSVAEHNASLEASFERRARGTLHRIADELALAPDLADDVGVLAMVERAVRDSDDMVGLRFEGNEGTRIQSGEVADIGGAEGESWETNRLYLAYPVLRDEQQIGRLVSGFELSALRAGIARSSNSACWPKKHCTGATVSCGSAVPRFWRWRCALPSSGRSRAHRLCESAN